MNITPEGFDDLAGLWQSAPDRAAKLARTAVIKSGADLQRIAKRSAPVDTGNLRNSITRTTTSRGDEITTEVGPTVNYGRFVEYGTSRMRPQPYMMPAADAVEPGFIKAMGMLGFEAIQ